MITFEAKGNFSNTDRFLRRMLNKDSLSKFEKYGQMGVNALSANTPKDTGLTASSWSYDINKTHNGVTITWSNSNLNDGVSIAVLLQYGHGTGSGAYIQGIDYINPSIAPVFEQLSNDAWNEVTKT